MVNAVQIPTLIYQTTGKQWNPAAPTFVPKSPGTKRTKETNGTKDHAAENRQEKQKETTAQLVNRAFVANKVTLNQSSQDIPSQTFESEAIAEQQLLLKKVDWTGGRLWCDHREEDPDEGNLSEGYEEEDNATMEADEPQGEKISVNDKKSKGEKQTANRNDTLVEIGRPSTKAPNIVNDPNTNKDVALPILNPNSSNPNISEVEPVIDEQLHLGDPGRGEEQLNPGEGDRDEEHLEPVYWWR
ncbi:hypothetical protein A4A49_40202 [Nicotiana attenuata]|uniref:Uncharacterized protein n=1 Tax=Nicotiana attenuata TaxID=49451 RepID=A0A1J6JQL7_NICAT|nr:hypothetical protein A4A49_40202 [Nicotiana attenuata]